MDAATCRVISSRILVYKDTPLSGSRFLPVSSYCFGFRTNHLRLARPVSLLSLHESRFIAKMAYYERPYPRKSQWPLRRPSEHMNKEEGAWGEHSSGLPERCIPGMRDGLLLEGS
jgi:hypothetical protein